MGGVGSSMGSATRHLHHAESHRTRGGGPAARACGDALFPPMEFHSQCTPQRATTAPRRPWRGAACCGAKAACGAAGDTRRQRASRNRGARGDGMPPRRARRRSHGGPQPIPGEGGPAGAPRPPRARPAMAAAVEPAGAPAAEPPLPPWSRTFQGYGERFDSKLVMPLSDAGVAYVVPVNDSNATDDGEAPCVVVRQAPAVAHDRGGSGDPGATGCTVWDAGMVLAGFFSAAKARGKIKASGEYFGMPCRVAVELGAGTGLAGLALAATQCATKRVVLTDIDPLVAGSAMGFVTCPPPSPPPRPPPRSRGRRCP